MKPFCPRCQSTEISFFAKCNLYGCDECGCVFDDARERNVTDEYLKSVTDYGLEKFYTEPENTEYYFLKWLPDHLLKLEEWGKLVYLLCNLDFIQHRSSSSMVCV